MIYTNINIDCYASRILSLQFDFLSQKSTIEKTIIGIKRVYKKHRVI